MRYYYAICIFLFLGLHSTFYASCEHCHDEHACYEDELLEEYIPFDADLFHKQQKVFHIDTELLLWTVQSGGLYYAALPNHCASPFQIFTPTGRYERTKYDWTPGFRITMGFFHAPHYWNAYAQYIFFLPMDRITAKRNF